MLKQTLVLSAVINVFGGISHGSAAEFGTSEEALAMLKRAIPEMTANPPAAINKFNFNDANFRDRDLFVFCFGTKDGRFTAHEALGNSDVRTLRDLKGKPFGKKMYEIATEGEDH